MGPGEERVTHGDDERARRDGYVDEQEEESFPASDPHSDWAGPGTEPEEG